MKDYIVTVEETYFDTTKFVFNRFYIVTEDDAEYKCLLKTVEKDKATFITIIDGEYRKLYILPWKVKNGNIKIKEVETLDEVVPLSKGKSEYKDLFYNTCDIKTGRCYKIKMGELTYNGFCSYRNKETINMVVHTNLCHLACITYDPTIEGKWIDNVKSVKFPDKPSIIHNTITYGTVMTINLIEIKEDRVYFKELV